MPLRRHLIARFLTKQTVFELSFLKSSGADRRSREVPLPEPELITPNV
jgi:hypothetical protein